MRRALVAGVACAGIALAPGIAFAQVQDTGVAPQQPLPQPGQPIVVQPPTSAEPPPAGTAAPQPAPAAKPKKPKSEEKEWYGWQTLLADAAAAGLMLGGELSHTTSIFDVGYGTYLLAPPVVHVVHGNAGPAFGSVGLRLVSPWVLSFFGIIAGAFILAGQQQHSSTDTVFGIGKDWSTPIAIGFDVGLISGYALAIGIDAFLIAYEKVDDAEYGKAAPPKHPQKWYTLAPTFGVNAHQGTVGIGGSF